MERENTISFFVPGIPAPGGSKKGFVNPKNGRVVIVDDAKRNKDWRAIVALAASQRFLRPLSGPLQVDVLFLMPRPKGHYGKRGLRPAAPKWPTTKPDATKIWRSTEDALKGIAWLDDAQVVRQNVCKEYCGATLAQPGAMLTIEALEPQARQDALGLQQPEEPGKAAF